MALTTPAPTGPLAGMRILDLTTVLLGPYSTRILGDLGADVIKVEPLEGEARRTSGPSRNPANGMAHTFMVLNRAKRAIAINLKEPAGRDAFLRLAATADAMVHNARVAAMTRLGLDYEGVRKVKPDIAYCYAVGFGSKGRYAGRPAFDDVIQGLTTFPTLLAEQAGRPIFVPINLADRVIGVYLANATLAALLHRARTGEGQEVEVPMFEMMAEMVLSEHLWDNYFVPPTKSKNRNRMFDRRPYKTKDGYICVMAGSDKMFFGFCDVVGRPELKSDPRFAQRGPRSAHAPEVYDAMQAALASRTSAQWLELLGKADIPCSPIHTLQSILDDPHLNDVDFFQVEEHPSEGKVRAMRLPMRFSGSPLMNRRPTPRVGEHTVALLTEAGMSEGEIASLIERGVVRADAA
ncbi:MAG: CoA transferase [Betaproteobacteria bacterium]|nr:CoA transferase [Betaproteobacteria bacterium]